MSAPDATPPAPTRIAQVMDQVRTRIAARQLTPGEKLPSIRAQAATLGLSTSTVVEAYERLAAEGLIRSRPGSGWTVAAPLAPLALAHIGPRRERAVDPLWVSRQSLEADDARWRPGCGWLPPDWLPQAALRRALRGLGRAEDRALTDYGPPQGLPALRQWLARRLAEQGVTASPQQILLTGSGTQAIDLVCRFLLQPGDAVLVDDPCYFNFLAVLRAHRVQVIGVPWTTDGPDLAGFEAAVAAHRPRLYLTNAGVHNPTGARLAAPTAHRVLRLAEAAGMTVVEDEVFADFETHPAPRYAALDGLQRVVQVGSFSKVMSAAVRSGHIAARTDWIEGLTDLRLATTFGGDALGAALVLAVLQDGQWRRHLDTLRLRLARARHTVAARLQAIGITPWVQPQGGLFLWGRLPAGVDASALSRAALMHGIVLAPGNVFSAGQTADGFMRFNVAQMDGPEPPATTADGLWPTLQTLLRTPDVRGPAPSTHARPSPSP
jgi:DNA-binding transcriptional MocR family regulator